jgi:hypothetical protein
MKFSTQMHQMGNNTGIPVPPEVVEALGGGKKPLVTVNVNGYEYRSAIATMGGRYLIAFSSDKRAATGIAGGDPIDVELELDTAPRTVDLPDDLASAIDAAGARAAWDKLAPSHQKAHVTSVEGAKAADTRERRVAAVITKLTEG